MDSIDIPSSVTTIGDYAFKNCGLKSITIPSSVTSIGKAAFQGCGNLNSIDIQASITSIPEGFCSSCSGLRSVSIPSSVTRIERHAFSACDMLTTIELPSLITRIDESAFFLCQRLRTVTCYSEECPSMGDDVFGASFINGSTLYVPEISIDKYKSADQWKEFGTILAIGTNGIGSVIMTDDLKNNLFDTSGKRVNARTKGLYIMNGKKYINK